jgi:hypothetical protein
VRIRTLALCLAAAAASGCLYSRVDEEWGEAFEENTAVQVADPNGAGSPEGPAGLDPVTSEEIANRYYKGQAAKPTRTGPAMVLEEIR